MDKTNAQIEALRQRAATQPRAPGGKFGPKPKPEQLTEAGVRKIVAEELVGRLTPAMEHEARLNKRFDEKIAAALRRRLAIDLLITAVSSAVASATVMAGLHLLGWF